MTCGQLPPMIIAAPDGSIHGTPRLFSAGSFYVNSNAGRFEDYIIHDVWFGFIRKTFPIRPEREAHVIAGASMGGFGAYNLAFKYREEFRVIAAVFPPLNLRYIDCKGHYFADFDPDCFAFKEKLKPFAPVGRFYGVIVVRQHRIVHPLYGWGPEALNQIADGNPVEMLYTRDIKPGEFEMYAASGGRDEFNVDAQIASFEFLAAKKGIEMTVQYDPTAHHSTADGKRFFPGMAEWLNQRLAPYAPK
jgi:S-formylglutathione hydrolase FrmB